VNRGYKLQCRGRSVPRALSVYTYEDPPRANINAESEEGLIAALLNMVPANDNVEVAVAA